jgi:hypothetical protein
MRGGRLLDEDSDPLLGPESGDKDGEEGAVVDAQLGTHGSPVANDGIACDAVGNHSDGVSAIAVTHEVLRLGSVDGDDGCRTRPHRSKQQALVAPVPPQPFGIRAQVFGYDVGSPVPQGEGMPDHMCTDTPSHHGGRPSSRQTYGSAKPDEIGSTTNAGTGNAHAQRHQFFEVHAAAVEGDHPDIEAAPVQARDQNRPLPLGAAGAEVAADEDNSREPAVRHRRAAFAIRRW